MAAAKDVGAPTVLLGGGVVANTRLRDGSPRRASAKGSASSLPSLPLCTDNAAMVACVGAARWKAGSERCSTSPPTRS